MEIPTNTNDNAKSRMDKFVEFVIERLKTNNSVDICDYDEGNCGKVPGITLSEARKLADMFVAKGYHASAYFIDWPRHGFRYVTIAKYVLSEHYADCAHTSLWA